MEKTNLLYSYRTVSELIFDKIMCYIPYIIHILPDDNYKVDRRSESEIVTFNVYHNINNFRISIDKSNRILLLKKK